MGLIFLETRDKVKKFQNLAESRVNNAIKHLRLIGNLSNKNNYQYTDEDVRKIMAAIDAEVKDLKSKFAKTRNRVDRFKL
jgi:rubrerythrin